MTNGRTNNEDSLIAQLLEETYQSLPRRDEAFRSPDLSKHFDEHYANSSGIDDPTLENFLSRQAVLINELEYLPVNGCYRLCVGGQRIDLPGNWGAFSALGRELVCVDLSGGELANLLAPMFGGHTNVVLIGQFGRAHLAFFANEDEFSLRWLEKFFSTEKKEAA